MPEQAIPALRFDHFRNARVDADGKMATGWTTTSRRIAARTFSLKRARHDRP
jgi:hypothetical protein